MAAQQPQRPGPDSLVGARIGDYSVVRRLARGGMAEVYLAHEQGRAGIERFVALKLILPHMTGEASFVSMFLHEARVAATLDHPNIAQVLAAGEHDGEPYIAMEYVHGETVHSLLRQVAQDDAEIPRSAALGIVTRACAGLHFAHERHDLAGQPLSIVHRDVSPSNLMVRFDGTVKVLDFGIAKAASQTTATASGVFKGKSGYMSPEQCADEPIDRRSDVFNLGILLYELTTLHRAFYGDNPVAIINKIANARFTAPSELCPGYPEQLETIVRRAMAVDPSDRYPTAHALQLDLEAFAQDHRLSLSPSEVGALMQARFGDRPYPSLALPPPGMTPQPESAAFTPTPLTNTVVAPSAGWTDAWTQRSRRKGLWAAAGLAATVGLGSWWMLAGDPATPSPPQAPAAVIAEPPAKAAPAPPPVEATPEAGPERVEPEPAPTPAPEPEKKKPTKKKRRPPRKRASKKKPRTAEHGPEGLYP